MLGVARLSKNWLIAKIALVYIELFRNVPLLLQIFFWYFGVLRHLPAARESVNVGDIIFLNIRGLYIPRPVYGDAFIFVVIAFFAAIVGTVFLARSAAAW